MLSRQNTWTICWTCRTRLLSRRCGRNLVLTTCVRQQARLQVRDLPPPRPLFIVWAQAAGQRRVQDYSQTDRRGQRRESAFAQEVGGAFANGNAPREAPTSDSKKRKASNGKKVQQAQKKRAKKAKVSHGRPAVKEKKTNARHKQSKAKRDGLVYVEGKKPTKKGMKFVCGYCDKEFVHDNWRSPSECTPVRKFFCASGQAATRSLHICHPFRRTLQNTKDQAFSAHSQAAEKICQQIQS